MLTKLTVRNFQKHKKRIIDLDQKITTIVGPTDSGKSALVRALRWLCLNKPSKKKHIRAGAKQARVDLLVDGHEVSRRRSTKGNAYYLDGRAYKAFGNDVPTDIANLLNISPLNFQGQLDKVFWLSDSAGQVAKELNAVINLTAIDKVTAAVSKKVRDSKTKVGLIDERYEQAKKEKSSLKWVLSANRDWKRVTALESAANEASSKVADLSDLLARVVRAQTSRENAGKAHKRLRIATIAAERYVAISAKRRELSSLIRRLQSAEAAASVKLPTLDGVERAFVEWQEYKPLVDNLDSLLIAVSTMEKRKCQAENELRQAEKRLRKTTRGRCPVCGRKM